MAEVKEICDKKKDEADHLFKRLTAEASTNDNSTVEGLLGYDGEGIALPSPFSRQLMQDQTGDIEISNLVLKGISGDS